MKISVKVLADFMLAGSFRQRSIVRNAKYPKLKDGKTKPQIVRYSEARAAVRDFCESGNDPKVFLAAVERLTKKKLEHPDKDASRIEDNIRGIKAYAAYLLKREFKLLPTPHPVYSSSGVDVSATPDLYVEEKAEKKLIKIDFSRQAATDESIEIMLKVMYEAAMAATLGVRPSDILYLDVERRKSYSGKKLNRKLKKEIDAALATIQDMWGSITPE